MSWQVHDQILLHYLVRSWFEAGRLSATSFEPASIVEFGFYFTWLPVNPSQGHFLTRSRHYTVNSSPVNLLHVSHHTVNSSQAST